MLFEDALRLARGMTYKAAASGLPLGGGKTVILKDPENPGEQRSHVQSIRTLCRRAQWPVHNCG
ncbi:MAG: Glu/Leu/Phe/Val dehydrogenase dimerization domain-containing protein [Alkalibacterium sp.]|nr:Glu/Leu/Phe/Val dehydrogenase dimerization domain-containing protein [Alkalibacterium sp.]